MCVKLEPLWWWWGCDTVLFRQFIKSSVLMEGRLPTGNLSPEAFATADGIMAERLHTAFFPGARSLGVHLVFSHSFSPHVNSFLAAVFPSLRHVDSLAL